MKLETLKRAKQIEQRLREIERARQVWGEEGDWFYVLMPFLAGERTFDVSASHPLPAPILRFRTACLDVLATEEAALKAELEAL